PQRLYRRGREEVPDGDQTVPFGRSRLAREGSDVTLIAWSAAVELCQRAADELAGEGVSAGVLDLRSLVPLDVEGLVAEVGRTGSASTASGSSRSTRTIAAASGGWSSASCGAASRSRSAPRRPSPGCTTPTSCPRSGTGARRRSLRRGTGAGCCCTSRPWTT